jgi:hypothetical protein
MENPYHWKSKYISYWQPSNFHIFEEFDQTKLPCFIHGKNFKVEKQHPCEVSEKHCSN